MFFRIAWAWKPWTKTSNSFFSKLTATICSFPLNGSTKTSSRTCSDNHRSSSLRFVFLFRGYWGVVGGGWSNPCRISRFYHHYCVTHFLSVVNILETTIRLHFRRSFPPFECKSKAPPPSSVRSSDGFMRCDILLITLYVWCAHSCKCFFYLACWVNLSCGVSHVLTALRSALQPLPANESFSCFLSRLRWLAQRGKVERSGWLCDSCSYTEL